MKLQGFVILILGLFINFSESQKAGCPENSQKVDSLPNFKGDSEEFPCQYAGFINVQQDQGLFYWYFRNETQSEDFPIVLWLNGGPGASSMTGLFEEDGPMEIQQPKNEVEIVLRENSWLQFAHLVYVDQPIGTGFSYTDGEYIGTEEEVADYFYQFLELFVQNFPETGTVDWIFVGESYAGKYTPWISKRVLSSGSPPINIKKIGLIDPLVFGLLQKTQTRDEVYGGLGILDPSQMNQFNAMQEVCQYGLNYNTPDQTARCSSIEDYLKNQTATVTLTDIRNFTSKGESDLLDVYFNQQSSEIQKDIMDAIHITGTGKTLPDIFGSDPEVYDAFAKTNDIYGEESLSIIDDLIKIYSVPFIIMEGVMDTLDGILGLEIYKNWLSEQCEPRTLMQEKLPNGECIPRGFIQDCSGAPFKFHAAAVWSAGHLIPEDQLQASNFVLKNFLNDGQYCDGGCDCQVEPNVCDKVLNNCNGNGQCKQQGEDIYCECSAGYTMADCSQKYQQVQVTNTTIDIYPYESWVFFQLVGFDELDKNINIIEFTFPNDQDFQINFYLFDPNGQKDFGDKYYQSFQNVENVRLQIREENGDFVVKDKDLFVKVTNYQATTLNNQQYSISKNEDAYTVQVNQEQSKFGKQQHFFLTDGIVGFIISISMLLLGILIVISAFYYDKKQRRKDFLKFQNSEKFEIGQTEPTKESYTTYNSSACVSDKNNTSRVLIQNQH